MRRYGVVKSITSPSASSNSDEADRSHQSNNYQDYTQTISEVGLVMRMMQRNSPKTATIAISHGRFMACSFEAVFLLNRDQGTERNRKRETVRRTWRTWLMRDAEGGRQAHEDSYKTGRSCQARIRGVNRHNTPSQWLGMRSAA